MRLIDADVLSERLLTSWDTADKEKKTEISDVMAFVVTPILVDTPTAYDLDKVVEQLEELQERHPYKVAGDYDTYSQYNQAWESCSDQAIEIVKSGGKV